MSQCSDALELVVIGKALRRKSSVYADSTADAAMEKAKKAGISWKKLMEPLFAQLWKTFVASVY